MKSRETLPLVSIIVPCFNEELSIPPFYAELSASLPTAAYDFEIIFVDDGSTDGTVNIVNTLSEQDIRISLVRLARNFGKEIAVTAGINTAQGDAAIMIDADLQFPPAKIPEFLAKWEAGADVVVGVRSNDNDYASWLKRFGSRFFHEVMQYISETALIAGSTDYRLIDRVVIDEFNRFTERNRLTRGLIDWLGFERAYVEFRPVERQFGDAGYSFRKLLGLALNSFVAMSLIPLKLAGYLGVIITLVAGVLGVAIVFEKYIFQTELGLSITGTASLATLIIFLVGIVLSSLGLIAMYIAAIHREVMNRPIYVVRRNASRPSHASSAQKVLQNISQEAPRVYGKATSKS